LYRWQSHDSKVPFFFGPALSLKVKAFDLFFIIILDFKSLLLLNYKFMLPESILNSATRHNEVWSLINIFLLSWQKLTNC